MKQAVQQLLHRKFVQDTLALQAGKASVAGISVLSSVLVARLMEPSAFGSWALVRSFFAIWLAFDLTGIAPSTLTRLGIAVGANDKREILNLMGFYVRVVALRALVMTITLALAGPPAAGLVYSGDGRVGALAALLSLSLVPDGLYNLIVIALQSRRSMRAMALLQSVNQVVMAVCVVGALLISPTVEAMVAGRLVYAYATMLLALAFYWRLRGAGVPVYPTLRVVLRRAWTVSARPYWRFGVALALDKNVANLYTQLPLQIVGILAGNEAAGYLQLALSGMNVPAVFTSAVFDNMQAVVPQAVGRRDFAALRANFVRVAGVLALGGAAFYAVFALFAPLLVPLVYGEAWLPAVPLIPILAVYGAFTTVGGIFGPLYRAFDLVRSALIVKVVALVVMLPLGIAWVEWMGMAGGAWLVSGLFVLSVGLTAVVTLPVLNQKASGAGA